MTAETSNAREWVDLLERAVPFLLDEGAKYDDDGSNEPLELAREIETLLASLSSDESALSPASLAFDGGREATPCPHTRDTNCDCAAPPPPADAEPKTLPVPTHVYLTDKAAVIVGDPQRGWDEEGPDAHNCDAMGCASIGPHVLARVPFTDERALSQQPEAADWITGDGLQGIKAEAHFLTQHKEEAVQRAGKRLLDRADKIIAALYQPPSAPVGVEGPLSLLRAGHWREVYIGHRCMQLELTYDYATWERLMAEVESALAQQPAAVGEEIMVNAAHDVFTLPLQPSGLSSGPRFVVHVPAPEQQPAAVDGPYRTVDGVVTVNGIALDEAVKLGDRYAATIEKRGMPRAAQVLEALVMIGRHALAAQHQEPKS